MTIRHVFIPLVLCIVTLSYSQKRSAIKLYEQAQQTRNIKQAAQLYQAAIDKDPSYQKAYSTLANLYYTTNQNKQEVEVLQAAIKQNNDRSLKMRLARAAYLSGQYQLAQSTLLAIAPIPAALKSLEDNINFSIDALTQATDYHPLNMGKKVNTPYDDYWPYLSIDEQEITTTVLITQDSTSFFSANEDLYKSKKTATGWTKSQAISPIINSPNNEGAQCLSADGKLMLFTACNRSTGIGSCDIYISHQEQGVWSPPQALPEPINSHYWDGHPSLSADGRYLYFASDRLHGLGKRDLYQAQITIDNKQISVKNVRHLGAHINSKEDEVSPFIHPDGKTLYFSSNGHIGLGRMDIYKTPITPDLTAPIINLGYPINTYQDEIGFTVNTRGDKAYFSSERDSSQKKDIYHFTLDTHLRPEACSYFEASIYDADTHEPIKGKVELRHINNGQVYYQHRAIDELMIPIRLKETYAISVEKEGYLFYSSQFSAEQGSPTPLIKAVYLKPIKANEHIDLHNILFEFNTAKLDTTFNSELKKALVIIQNNPQLHFCIEGHTDSIGDKNYNLKLSEQRALAVRAYFIEHRIAKERLSYKGYGDSQPISDNAAENRRTSLRIIPPQEPKQ